MKRIAAKSTDEYIATFPEDVQEILKKIRLTIKKAAPKATERISYGIPSFHLDGSYLVYFAGFKNHVSVYPAPRGEEEFKKVLAPYKGGKGTVQFPLSKPIPYPLITKIVKFLIKRNSARASATKGKKKK
jgi:uncharacterized protein YdhG (YjbR/CyaY superfamily)